MHEDPEYNNDYYDGRSMGIISFDETSNDIRSIDGNYTNSITLSVNEPSVTEEAQAVTELNEVNELPKEIEQIINKVGNIIGYKVKPKLIDGKKLAPNRKFTSGTDLYKKLKQAKGYLKRTEKLKDPIKKERFKLIQHIITRVTGGFIIKEKDGNNVYYNDRQFNLRENYNKCMKHYENEYLNSEISQNEYNIPKGTRSIGTNTI